MEIRCIWEHNGDDSLIYSENFIGAFTRGENRARALEKMPREIASYLKWRGVPLQGVFEAKIVQEKNSALLIRDADSDVIFDAEKAPLSRAEYEALKALALKSARDFLALYEAMPDMDKSCLPARETFYGRAPRTAREMYAHTKNVNEYYFGEIGVAADNESTILECRRRGFTALERRDGFLNLGVREGSYGEMWSIRKLIRRFVWHDRIHAKAMYRMALKTFGGDIPNVFHFKI